MGIILSPFVQNPAPGAAPAPQALSDPSRAPPIFQALRAERQSSSVFEFHVFSSGKA